MTEERRKVEDELGLRDFIPSPAADEPGALFRAGKPLDAVAPRASFDAVVEALRTVYDPEIPVNIYELGLIYKLDIGSRGDVAIEMTLTAPACPVAGSLPGMVAETVSQVEGVGQVEVKLVWDPPWSPARMSDDAKLALGMD